VYFTGDTGLYRLTQTGTTYSLTKLADLAAPPGRLALTPAYVYYIEGDGREVRRVRRPP